jgi:hypothetical protein
VCCLYPPLVFRVEIMADAVINACIAAARRPRVCVVSRVLNGTLSDAELQVLSEFVVSLELSHAQTSLLRDFRTLGQSVLIGNAVASLNNGGLQGNSVRPYNTRHRDTVCLLHPDNRLGAYQMFNAAQEGWHLLSEIDLGGHGTTRLFRYEIPSPCSLRVVCVTGEKRVVACRAANAAVLASGLRLHGVGQPMYSSVEFDAVVEFCAAQTSWFDRRLLPGKLWFLLPNVSCRLIIHVGVA